MRNTDRTPTSGTSGKRAYIAPQVRNFGSLRELTLDQKTTPMPQDNQGDGKGGKT